ARQKWLRSWCAVPAPVVMFESPHRVNASVRDMLEVCGPERKLTVARELTKRFEQVHTMALGDAMTWFEADTHRAQGEFVLIIHEADVVEAFADLDPQTVTLLEALLDSLSVRDAARVAAKVSGLPRDVLYARALAMRGSAQGDRRLHSGFLLDAQCGVDRRRTRRIGPDPHPVQSITFFYMRLARFHSANLLVQATCERDGGLRCAERAKLQKDLWI